MKEDKEQMRNGEFSNSEDSENFSDRVLTLIEKIEQRNLILIFLDKKIEIEAKKRYRMLYLEDRELAKGYICINDSLIKRLWIEAETEAKQNYRKK